MWLWGVKIVQEKFSLDTAPDELSQIPGDDPERQVLSADAGRRQREDGPGFRHVPAAGAGAVEEAAKDEEL